VIRGINRADGAINSNMQVVRRAWMTNMACRENKLLDSQLMGHAISSASFFASANLIIIAAAAGALFGGERAYQGVLSAPLVEDAPRWLFEAKLGLVTIALARGLLDFVWSIRQMNYTLAAIGAAPPETAPREVLDAYGEATADLINPALHSFSAGVRGYYFALAAAAWMAGPYAFAGVTGGAMLLLYWRQKRSTTARGIRKIRALLEADAARPQSSSQPDR